MAIVTPEKAGTVKRLFLMNTKTGTYVETENYISAKLLKSQLVRLGSEPDQSYAIAYFNSESGVREFLKKKSKVPEPTDHNVQASSIPANNSDRNCANADDSRKMPAVSFPSNNSERNVAQVVDNSSTNECRDIVVLADDVVPFRSVQPDTPRMGSSSLSSSEIGAIRAVTLGIGARIEVYRWSLPACKFDIYSYKLMMGSNLYWTHKPTMWIDLAQMQNEKTALDIPESMSLHKAMDY
jgi:hypothetical protein